MKEAEGLIASIRGLSKALEEQKKKTSRVALLLLKDHPKLEEWGAASDELFNSLEQRARVIDEQAKLFHKEHWGKVEAYLLEKGIITEPCHLSIEDGVLFQKIEVCEKGASLTEK